MSISPVYLNPAPNSFPVEEKQLHLFLSPHHHQASPSLSGPTLFNAIQDQSGKELGWSRPHNDQVENYMSCDRFGDQKLLLSPSPLANQTVHKLSSSEREDGDSGTSGDGSEKWMPSKIRLMQKMMNTSCSSEESERLLKFTLKFQDQRYHSNGFNSTSNSNTSTTRVCSDCNTTTTPLWRSGPRGPKSLCNACGIRQRKARRAMAAAATNGTVAMSSSSSSTKTKVLKEKKSRSTHVAQCKKLCRPPDSPRSQKKLCFKNLALSLRRSSALQVLPHDVEEAAILLMELSCGFIQS